MSHIAKISVEIKDLAALRQACARLGFSFQEGQRSYAWYGRYQGDTPLPEGITQDQLGKCDHAIRVPGAKYEIGLVQQEGRYALLWDSWEEGGLAQILGANAERLVQAYAIEAAKNAAVAQGHSVYEEALEDGSVRLHVQVAA